MYIAQHALRKTYSQMHAPPYTLCVHSCIMLYPLFSSPTTCTHQFPCPHQPHARTYRNARRCKYHSSVALWAAKSIPSFSFLHRNVSPLPIFASVSHVIGSGTGVSLWVCMCGYVCVGVYTWACVGGLCESVDTVYDYQHICTFPSATPHNHTYRNRGYSASHGLHTSPLTTMLKCVAGGGLNVLFTPMPTAIKNSMSFFCVVGCGENDVIKKLDVMPTQASSRQQCAQPLPIHKPPPTHLHWILFKI